MHVFDEHISFPTLGVCTCAADEPKFLIGRIFINSASSNRSSAIEVLSCQADEGDPSPAWRVEP